MLRLQEKRRGGSSVHKGIEVGKSSGYPWSRELCIGTGVGNGDKKVEGCEAGRRTCA